MCPFTQNDVLPVGDGYFDDDFVDIKEVNQEVVVCVNVWVNREFVVCVFMASEFVDEFVDEVSLDFYASVSLAAR